MADRRSFGGQGKTQQAELDRKCLILFLWDRHGERVAQTNVTPQYMIASNMSANSKFLSFILRHKPEAVGIDLDRNGWAVIDQLLAGMKSAGREMSRDELLGIVESSEKNRFTISEDGSRIRAAQGHSIEIDLGLHPTRPPNRLYHGTSIAHLESILDDGLLPKGRQKVHLSADPITAEQVGRRHGKPVVLIVDAEDMHSTGHEFFCAENGVWLADDVPAKYLSIMQQ